MAVQKGDGSLHPARSIVGFTVASREMQAELVRARAILGPDCPKCGHYLRQQHIMPKQGSMHDLYVSCIECPIPNPDRASNLAHCFTRYEMAMLHPEIAKELGIA